MFKGIYYGILLSCACVIWKEEVYCSKPFYDILLLESKWKLQQLHKLNLSGY